MKWFAWLLKTWRCDHDWEEFELYGDTRLHFDARFIDVCKKCGKIK